MILYQEILKTFWERSISSGSSPSFKSAEVEIVKSVSYQTLNAIKLILEDESYDDEQCYKRIEKIIRTFDCIGSNTAPRHTLD